MSHTAAPDSVANSVPQDPLPAGTEPTATEQERSGSVVETVKSYLGLGGSSTGTGFPAETSETSETSGTSLADQNTTDTTKSYLGLGGSSTGTGFPAETSETSSTSLAGQNTTDTTKSDLGLGGSSAATGTNVTADTSGDPLVSEGTTSGSTQVDEGTTDTTQHGDSMAQEMKDATGTHDPAQKEAIQETEERKAEDPTHKPPQGAGEANKGVSGGRSGGLENRSAIPTAGGEQLGEKHWGESKKIPDNPPLQESAGVSSSDGQPTGKTGQE
ncbi:hypothetical protein K431DRAFT_117354 [Polychaeton citri CBS 116435]|uniref:Uncharacterized protein n=1 Tax=Polychaeton citri CBS 116435 TaxID=1314669 RepID=A0A9P4QHL1_9PEZI|nr:hypothetical protein K431DRAFT_117354 [Polychaeton citri CBS 116435]